MVIRKHLRQVTFLLAVVNQNEKNKIRIEKIEPSVNRVMNVKCHGMTESLKVYWKHQSIEDSTSKCLFLLFWPVSCVSLISLIEI